MLLILAVVIYGEVLRGFGKGYVYSVIVSFRVIVSFCFSVFIVKEIFRVAATHAWTRSMDPLFLLSLKLLK